MNPRLDIVAAEGNMNANTTTPWLDPDFLENQRKLPTDVLLRYAGQHISPGAGTVRKF